LGVSISGKIESYQMKKDRYFLLPFGSFVRVQKFSDGLFIRIPKKVAEDMDLNKGDYVKITWDGEEIRIRKV